MKSMVDKVGVEKASRTPASSGVPTLSQSGWIANPGAKEDVKFPYREAVGALVWMTTMIQSDIAAQYVLWPGSTLDWRIKKALLKIIYYLFTRRESGGSRMVSRAMNSAWRRPRAQTFWSLPG